jgi:hypothetical protein
MKRTIDIHNHWVREEAQAGEIEVSKINDMSLGEAHLLERLD